MKRKLVIFICCFLSICFVGLANATITVPSQVQFYFDNGTSFTHPGVYMNVTKISDVWYFDDVAYAGSVDMSLDDVVGLAVGFGVFAVAIAFVVPFVLRKRKGE